jgi:actin-related protein
MYMPDEEERTGLVIDNGSAVLKAGFTGDAAPRSCFPSVVGHSKHKGLMIAMNQKGSYAGDEAHENRGTLNISRPIRAGRVADWKDAETLWHHTFYEALKVPPEEHPVLMTDAPLNPKAERERQIELLFETFNAPAAYIGMQAVLALYASGRTTGLVLDCGHGASHAAPVYEGYALPHCISEAAVTGEDLTDALRERLQQKGYPLTTLAELEIVRELKERMCSVAMDYARESAQAEEDPRSFEKKYALPDGSQLYLGTERLAVPEALFKPSLIGKPDAKGLHQTAADVVAGCVPDVQASLFANVVLAGGSTMFPNCELRLARELAGAAPPGAQINVVAPPERKYSAWIGGSILSSLSTFSVMWITKEDYEETGAGIVHRKCF